MTYKYHHRKALRDAWSASDRAREIDRRHDQGPVRFPRGWLRRTWQKYTNAWRDFWRALKL